MEKSQEYSKVYRLDNQKSKMDKYSDRKDHT